jgi:hypothetical protein
MTLAIFITVIGAAGFVSNLVQRSRAERDRDILMGQIGQLISSAQIQATHDDIARLSDYLDKGFDRVVAAIQSASGRNQTIPTPPATPEISPRSEGPALPPALVRHIQVTQRRAPSDNPVLPYAVQIILQTDQIIDPVAFGFVCDGEVGDIKFFLAGQSAYMNVQTGIGAGSAKM